jgi:endoglucanase Acf2
MNEPDLPASMGFMPWDPTSKCEPNYSTSAIQAIATTATSEVLEDVNAQTNLDSMYFSGKVCSLHSSTRLPEAPPTVASITPRIIAPKMSRLHPKAQTR